MMPVYRTVAMLQIIIAVICGSGAYALYDNAREKAYKEAYSEGEISVIMSLPIENLGNVKTRKDDI
jgi:hypothetical protein